MTAQEDYFGLFGLPRRYEIDRDALEAAYERLTLAHHPDFFSTAPDAERAEAERMSASVNEGYRVLRDDAARAGYLLRLWADGTGADALDSNALPDGFLQEMFLLQEEVEDLSEDDSEAAQARKAELRNEAEAKLRDVAAERSRLFGGADGEPGPGALQAIQRNLNCTRYLMRLLERLDGKRDDD